MTFPGLPPKLAFTDRDFLSRGGDDRPGLRAKEGISSNLLAPFDRLQQERDFCRAAMLRNAPTGVSSPRSEFSPRESERRCD